MDVGRATALLSRLGVRILPGDVIGIWSDLDRPEIRRALWLLGMGELPVRYLDGDGVPIRDKLRHVLGEPCPSYVREQMEHATEPWAVRGKPLGKDWRFVPWPAPPPAKPHMIDPARHPADRRVGGRMRPRIRKAVEGPPSRARASSGDEKSSSEYRRQPEKEERIALLMARVTSEGRSLRVTHAGAVPPR